MRKSTAAMVSSFHDIGVVVLGIENPIYKKADALDEVRHQILEKYGKMRAQVDFVHAAAEWFNSEVQTKSSAKRGIISRSTGTLNTMQALAENLTGARHSFDGLSELFPWGLLDARQPQFQKWRVKQQALLDEAEKAGKKTGDDKMLEREPAMFLPMDWATPSEFQSAKNLSSIKVNFLIGSADRLAFASEQLEAIEAFSQRFPDIRSRVYGLPVKHDPIAGYQTSEIKSEDVRQGRAAQMVIDHILNGDQTGKYFASPLFFNDTVHSMPPNEACTLILGQSYVKSKPWDKILDPKPGK